MGTFRLASIDMTSWIAVSHTSSQYLSVTQRLMNIFPIKSLTQRTWMLLISWNIHKSLIKLRNCENKQANKTPTHLIVYKRYRPFDAFK